MDFWGGGGRVRGQFIIRCGEKVLGCGWWRRKGWTGVGGLPLSVPPSEDGRLDSQRPPRSLLMATKPPPSPGRKRQTRRQKGKAVIENERR